MLNKDSLYMFFILNKPSRHISMVIRSQNKPKLRKENSAGCRVKAMRECAALLQGGTLISAYGHLHDTNPFVTGAGLTVLTRVQDVLVVSCVLDSGCFRSIWFAACSSLDEERSELAKPDSEVPSRQSPQSTRNRYIQSQST